MKILNYSWILNAIFYTKTLLISVTNFTTLIGYLNSGEYNIVCIIKEGLQYHRYLNLEYMTGCWKNVKKTSSYSEVDP